MQSCPTCGAELTASARRCRVCGAPVVPGGGGAGWPERPPPGPPGPGLPAVPPGAASPPSSTPRRSVPTGVLVAVVSVAAVLALVAGYLTVVRATTPSGSPRPLVPGGVVPPSIDTTAPPSSSPRSTGTPTTSTTVPDTSFPLPPGPLLPSAGGDADPSALVPRWRAEMPGGGPVVTLLVADDLVLAVAASRIAAFDRVTGNRRWSTQPPGGVNDSLLDGDLLVVATEGGTSAYDVATGAIRWQVLGRPAEAVAVDRATVYALVGDNVVSHERADGRIRSTFRTEPGRTAVDLAVLDGTVFVSFDIGIGAYEPTRGALAWTDQSSCSRETLVVGPGVVVCGRGSTVVGLDAATGDERFVVPTVWRGVGYAGDAHARAVVGGRAVAASDGGHVVAADPSSHATLQVVAARGDGRPPAVAATATRVAVVGARVEVYGLESNELHATTGDAASGTWAAAVAIGGGTLAASRTTGPGAAEVVLFALP